MPRDGAHRFTIDNRHAEAVAALKGFRFDCSHRHVNGRRCAVRVVARMMYCDTHAFVGSGPCSECFDMAHAFGLELT